MPTPTRTPDPRTAHVVTQAVVHRSSLPTIAEIANALEQTAAAMDALHPDAEGDMSDAEYARLWNATRQQLDVLLDRIMKGAA